MVCGGGGGRGRGGDSRVNVQWFYFLIVPTVQSRKNDFRQKIAMHGNSGISNCRVNCPGCPCSVGICWIKSQSPAVPLWWVAGSMDTNDWCINLADLYFTPL